MSDHCTGCGAEADDGRRRFIIAATGLAFAAALPMRLLHALERRGQRVNSPLPASDSVSIDTDNQVILVRWDSKVYAFNLSCPHQNTALRWQADEQRFQWPKHKSRYQPDGTFTSGRATRGMDRLAIRREGNGVSVDVDTMYKQDEDRAGWEGAVVVLSAG